MVDLNEKIACKVEADLELLEPYTLYGLTSVCLANGKIITVGTSQLGLYASEVVLSLLEFLESEAIGREKKIIQELHQVAKKLLLSEEKEADS